MTNLDTAEQYIHSLKKNSPVFHQVFQQTKPRVLLIEDNELLRLIYRDLFEHMGFYTIIVNNAEEAIALFTKHLDLIVVDIGLPGMDGNALCRQRRAYESSHQKLRTPMFAYSAYGDLIEEECLAVGFDGFGEKPMNNHELYRALQNLLPTFTLTSFENYK